jgi:anti-anti-sigma factor
MNIDKTTQDGIATLKLTGWLETQAAVELQGALDALEPDTHALVLDLSALEYISSAGLRQLVAAHKKMGGELTVKNVRPEVFEVLRLTGIAPRLNIV